MADIDRVVYEPVSHDVGGPTVRAYRVLLDGVEVGTVEQVRATRRKRGKWRNSGDTTDVSWFARGAEPRAAIGHPWGTRHRAVEILLGQRRG